LDAAIREVREETGLNVQIQSLTGYYYEPSEDRLHFVFVCFGNGDTPVPNSSEISDCQYWPVDNLPRPISDFTIRRIRDALNSAGLPLPAIGPTREWLE
jgi:8-oxo-dGTP diphosphatase